MILEFTGVDYKDFGERPVEYCEAVIASEPRSVNNAINVRMLSVDRPSQGLSGGEMTCARRIRWCADVQAARISQI